MSQTCCKPDVRTPSDNQSEGLQMPGAVELTRIALAGFAIVFVWLQLLDPHWLQLFGLVALVVCGYPIVKEALSALLEKRMTMELSMTIALGAALLIGEVFTALVIVLFVLIAEELEHLTVRRGRRSISTLLDLLPRVASVKRGDSLVDIEVNALKVGDIVVVRPGSRVVVDGVVIAGASHIDQSTITGESFPASKKTGDAVYAGTMNQSGALEVRTERVGSETAFGQIVHAVEQAEKSRAPIQRLADRIAGFLVLFALAAALLTFLITHSARDTISVIIVAGACGVAAGTPLAILGSIGRAAQRGSIVKGGLFLERLADIDTVVFDKTGTLTFGTPFVVSVLPVSGESSYAVLAAAAAAERFSEHPLARAILQRAEELELKPSSAVGFASAPGRGVSCQVDKEEVVVGNRALFAERGITGSIAKERPEHVSEVLVARSGALIGVIHIADNIRPEARQAVARLKRMGIRSVMLTGDAQPIATEVASQLRIDEFAAELKPEDKRVRVAEMMRTGHKAAMVGDGVNDAPALMEAYVGVAVGTGTDVALESADVVLIGSDLLRFVETVRIARQCRRVIMFNFIGTIAVDTIGMLLAFLGMLSPMIAVLIHVGSEVAFILNAARLFPVFKRPHNNS